MARIGAAVVAMDGVTTEEAAVEMSSIIQQCGHWAKDCPNQPSSGPRKEEAD